MPTSKLSLHDCLSLGEIELGLQSSENSSKEETDRSVEELQRLPLFLRILSLTRPLARISILEDTEPNGEEDDLVNRTVERLEHVAATYSVAEGVDVVTSYLAPHTCRKISKLPPLKKTNQSWKTKELAAVARNPWSVKRKRAQTSTSREGQNGNEDTIMMEGSSDEEELEEEDTPSKKRHKTVDRRDSLEAVVEDSESTFVKTLSELASLVIASLAPIEESEDHSNVSLTIDDSILSESATESGGAMEGSDLGSTVAAIMFNTSVLQYRHVAVSTKNLCLPFPRLLCATFSLSHYPSFYILYLSKFALCRAAIPQVGDLMTRMGANCPASVASLLQGCVDANSLAIDHGGNASISKASKQSVQALAKLSNGENQRVQNKLQSLSIMIDVQLTLSMESPDESTMACLLISHLSKELLATKKHTKNSNTKRPTKQLSKQVAGDASADFRASHASSSDSNKENDTKESMVAILLSDNAELYRKALEYLASGFWNNSNKKEYPNGKLCLMLKAYNWLLLVPVLAASNNHTNFGILIQCFLQTVSPALRQLASGRHQQIKLPHSDSLPNVSSFDRALNLLRSSLVLTVARIYALSVNGFTEELTEIQKSMLTVLKQLQPISKFTQDFGAKIEGTIKSANAFGLLTTIVFDLAGLKTLERWQLKSDSEEGLKLLVRVFNDNTGDDSTAIQLDLLSRISLLLLEIQGGDHPTSSFEISKIILIRDTLKSILYCKDQQVPSRLLQDDQVSKFVVHATSFLSARDEIQVPLIMAPQLELISTKISSVAQLECTSTLSDTECEFFLLLLHAFEFLYQTPKSPFAFDPRTLPIKEALALSKSHSSKSQNQFLNTKLEEYTEKYCPEILAQSKGSNSRYQYTNLNSRSRRDVMILLRSTIRMSVQDSKIENDDEDAIGIEELFLDSKSKLPDSDLCCAVVSALLASPHKPPPSFTYPMLCRDPLVLLKCPLKVWKCKGLRRITLAVLCSLLESNTLIIENSAPLEESAEELLASRDALVIRCLLTVMSGSTETNLAPIQYCSMTTSILRSFVSKHRGLVALLMKQGLTEKALDWLVENVPETMNDSQELLQMLSNRRSLTPAERLTVAAAVLRIAIVQGHANEADAANMAYSALSQFVDAFFLVVGPVGVPVNALIVDDSEHDVTQISRKAAFRILQSLVKVRGRRSSLRKECGMALHKIASLCKGESVMSGVAGAVAGRRKSLLKEIFDAVTKAANAMGSPDGYQISTA
jgi:hypothetical protein